MDSMIKDIALAPSGHQKIAWVKEHMPLLNILNERYGGKKIFDGLNMVVTIHLEAKTAYLAQGCNHSSGSKNRVPCADLEKLRR